MVARYDEDDFPDEDRVVEIHEGHAYALPKSAMRLDSDSRHLLGAIQRRSLAVAELEAEIAELTSVGREAGISWSLLGAAQGLTGEALRRRSLDDA